MKNIAIRVYGVVGGGVTAVIDENREKIERVVGDSVYVKYILDLRDFPDSPYGDRVVHDASVIMDDDSVCLVAEVPCSCIEGCVGGVCCPYELVVLVLHRHIVDGAIAAIVLQALAYQCEHIAILVVGVAGCMSVSVVEANSTLSEQMQNLVHFR